MCATGSVLRDYWDQGWRPEVQRPIMDMRLNASGIRETARVLRVSTHTVLTELRLIRVAYKAWRCNPPEAP
jgi:transposase-like protein